MKKSGVMVLVILILIISVISFVNTGSSIDVVNRITGRVTEENVSSNETEAEPEEECVDSDGGENYYVKGEVTKGAETKVDRCDLCTGACLPDMPDCPVHCGGLIEYYCDGDNIVETAYVCPNYCEDGACLKESEPRERIIVECTDSDGKNNYDEKGYVTLTYSDGTSGQLTDYCSRSSGTGEHGANDHFCSENADGTYSSFVGFQPCEYGCSDGACLAERICPTIIAWRIENGRCIADTGCDYDPSTYTYYDTEEICINQLKEEPEPEPAPTVCAAKIVITFDKEVYYVGDYMYLTQVILDSEGNPIPHYRFYILYYDFLNDKWEGGGSTSVGSDGYTRPRFKLEENHPGLDFGKFKAKVYTKQIGSCDSVEASFELEIRKRGPVPCGIGTCVPEEEAEEVEAIPEDKIFYKCNGCELGNKCYPMGYRKEGKYCSDNNEFIDQSKAGTCDNNFECKSNVCISGECVEESLMRRIIKWFRKLFGIKPKPPEVVTCSKLLIEKNIGDYEYIESAYGNAKESQVPLYSEGGEQIGVVKCCVSGYYRNEEPGGMALVCPFDSREDIKNSLKWLSARGELVLKEYKGQEVYGNDNAVVWIHKHFILATGFDPNANIPFPDDIADAYLDKYPSDL